MVSFSCKEPAHQHFRLAGCKASAPSPVRCWERSWTIQKGSWLLASKTSQTQAVGHHPPTAGAKRYPLELGGSGRLHGLGFRTDDSDMAYIPGKRPSFNSLYEETKKEMTATCGLAQTVTTHLTQHLATQNSHLSSAVLRHLPGQSGCSQKRPLRPPPGRALGACLVSRTLPGDRPVLMASPTTWVPPAQPGPSSSLWHLCGPVTFSTL